MRGPDSNRVRFCNTLMSRSLGRAPRARAGLRGRRSGTRRPGSSPVDVPAEPLRVRADGRFSPRYLDTDAVKVIRRLNAHGFTAYLVGGCVRDLWVSAEPKDFDIATEATPRQVKRLFRNSRIIGRRFRLVHVTFHDKVLDVSTFRAQVEASEDPHDPMIRTDNVFGTAGEDARRRDFTMNGLFYDLQAGELIDYVGGLNDLERRVIETIGDPWVRFREDPVRMLRAIKFAGRLDLRLADDVFQAMLDCKDDLKKAAAPRLFEEIVRLLNRGGAYQSTRLLYKTGIMDLLLPEVSERLDEKLAADSVSPMWGYLRALDECVRSGTRVSQVVMLGCLFLDLFDELLYDEGANAGIRDLTLCIDRVLRPLALRMHMSRRDAFRLKQVLVAQRRLAGLVKIRGRRGASNQLMSREYFDESLHLFRIMAETRGRFADEVADWGERVRR